MNLDLESFGAEFEISSTISCLTLAKLHKLYELWYGDKHFIIVRNEKLFHLQVTKFNFICKWQFKLYIILKKKGKKKGKKRKKERRCRKGRK